MKNEFSGIDLEDFWSGILSRNEPEIIAAFLTLPPLEQENCRAHLVTMMQDPSFHQEQRESARIALDILRK